MKIQLTVEVDIAIEDTYRDAMVIDQMQKFGEDLEYIWAGNQHVSGTYKIGVKK